MAALDVPIPLFSPLGVRVKTDVIQAVQRLWSASKVTQVGPPESFTNSSVFPEIIWQRSAASPSEDGK